MAILFVVIQGQENTLILIKIWSHFCALEDFHNLKRKLSIILLKLNSFYDFMFFSCKKSHFSAKSYFDDPQQKIKVPTRAYSSYDDVYRPNYLKELSL